MPQLVEVAHVALEEGEDVVGEDEWLCIRAVQSKAGLRVRTRGFRQQQASESGGQRETEMRREVDGHGLEGADQPRLELVRVDWNEHG